MLLFRVCSIVLASLESKQSIRLDGHKGDVMPRFSMLIVLSALMLVLAACGGDDDADDAAPDDLETPEPVEEVTDEEPEPTPTIEEATEDEPDPTPEEEEVDQADPEPTPEPTPTEEEVSEPEPEPADPEVSTVTDNVSMPSSLTFAPDNRMFFIEVWTGTIRIVEDGQLLDEPFATLAIPQVDGFTEWGILGLALHPDFEENAWIYIFHTVPDDANSPVEQRIVRLTADGNTAADEEIIVDGLPFGPNCCHNGGRMIFGPDGHLYVSLGDVENDPVSQDPDNIAGSILRYTEDGAIPDDNPFGSDNPVYAYGLRNPYGLTFHPETDELWITENGPNGFDEVNLIQPGENYGWPNARGMAGDPDYIDPIWATGESEAIGPTGIQIPTGAAIPELEGRVMFCDWNSGTARVLEISDDYEVLDETSIPIECNLDITEGPDGALYLSSTEAIYRYGP
jgi:aldose sugar dehydrogenase